MSSANVQGIIANKFAFVSPDEQEFECIKQFLSKRLEEGHGECFIQIGLGDGQSPGLSPESMVSSLQTVERLAKQLDASLIHLRDQSTAPDSKSKETVSLAVAAESSKNGSGAGGRGKRNRAAHKPPTDKRDSNTTPPPKSEALPPGQNSWLVKEFLLRRHSVVVDFVDVRVAVVGNVDAGKSTLLGVLTHSELDDGRGLARLRLFRHKHEIESGRTSSVANDILGFSSNGEIVNRPLHGKLDWPQICHDAAKIITFIDLAGHERYLKTTVFGLTGHVPDYVMLLVGANAGVIGMTKEHLGLSLALSMPVFIVITKIDMCPPNILNDTLVLLFRILKSQGCRKFPLLVTTMDDVVCTAFNFTSERICPVFTVSNVTGLNLDLLRAFLNLLVPRGRPRLDAAAEFMIDEIYNVTGAGTVIAGTMLAGVMRVNEVHLLGPDSRGHFVPVTIKSIHRKRMPVDYTHGGQTASFAIKRPKTSQLRRGMFLVSRSLEPKGCLEFSANILILHHPTTINVGYQAMVHTGTVRQTATIISIHGRDRMRTGDKSEVFFRFIKRPEYLKPGQQLVFREGKTKAVGTVNATTPYGANVLPSSSGRGRRAQPTSVQVAAQGRSARPLAGSTTTPTNQGFPSA